MNKDRWFVIGAAIVIPLVMLLAFNALVVQPAIGEYEAAPGTAANVPAT